MDEQNFTIVTAANRKPLMSALPRPTWRELMVLVLGYVVLDWASYIHPLHGLNITPWNPAPALGLVFLLRFGLGAIPAMAIAIVLAETMVRGMPASLPMTFIVAGLIVACYWIIARALLHLLPCGALLTDRRSLLVWAATVLGGSLLGSGMVVGTLSLAGYVPYGNGGAATLQYWVGEAAGILVTMPLMLMLFDESGRGRLRGVLAPKFAAILAAATVAALWVAFGLGKGVTFQYSYVLLLPVAWAAASHGLPGAVVAAATVQLGIIATVQWLGIATIAVVDIQMLTVAIALFGFFIGMVVDETRRISAELQQTLRLAAAGEMAGAMAHELNQPLTALGAYGSACEHLLDRNETGDRLREAVRGMVRESGRAAEVMRRLRDFFRTGSTHLETVPLAESIDGAIAGTAQRMRQDAIRLTVDPMPVCHLLCDRLQIEVVLRNLISNAADAISSLAAERRWIRVGIVRDGLSAVCISIEDGGAGLDEQNLARLFVGFQSTKSSGLGLGLVISRAIAEAHGGNLWAEVADHGIFRLRLPIAGEEVNVDRDH